METSRSSMQYESSYTHIQMFLKPAKSDMENDFKYIQKCPLKIYIYSGNWKLETRLFEWPQGWITSLKKNKTIFIQFFISKPKKTFIFSCRGGKQASLRPPQCPAKDAFFLRAPVSLNSISQHPDLINYYWRRFWQLR